MAIENHKSLENELKIMQLLNGRSINEVNPEELDLMKRVDNFVVMDLQRKEEVKIQPIEFEEKADVSKLAGTQIYKDYGLRTAQAYRLGRPDLKDSPYALQDIMDLKIKQVIDKEYKDAENFLLSGGTAIWHDEQGNEYTPTVEQMADAKINTSEEIKRIAGIDIAEPFIEANAKIKDKAEQVKAFMEETGATIEQVKQGNPNLFNGDNLLSEYGGTASPK